MAIKKVGVAGCGLMGSGIAQVAAQAGYPVVVREINEEFLNNGMNRLKSFLAEGVKRGKNTQENVDKILGNLKPTTSMQDFADCDIVIEVIVENMAMKKEFYGELDRVCKPETIFASNTSSMCIIEMASATKRADRFVGMHFFNPVPLMKLVEVVKSIVVTDEVVDEAKAFAESLGKTAVVCKDSTGFIVNRLLIPYMLEAVRVWENGLASKEDIDLAMQLGASYPMGPFTLMDFVGHDTTLAIANVFFDEYRDARFAPPSTLKRMVLAGQLGRKTGKGFYDYTKK